MIVRGSYTLDAPRERVWSALYDPKSLLSVIPGCQGIEQVSANGYEHHVAVNRSQVAAAVNEALAKYLGWDVRYHKG